MQTRHLVWPSTALARGCSIGFWRGRKFVERWWKHRRAILRMQGGILGGPLPAHSEAQGPLESSSRHFYGLSPGHWTGACMLPRPPQAALTQVHGRFQVGKLLPTFPNSSRHSCRQEFRTIKGVQLGKLDTCHFCWGQESSWFYHWFWNFKNNQKVRLLEHLGGDDLSEWVRERREITNHLRILLQQSHFHPEGTQWDPLSHVSSPYQYPGAHPQVWLGYRPVAKPRK